MFKPNYVVLVQYIDTDSVGEQYGQVCAMQRFFHSKRAAIGYGLRHMAQTDALVFQIGEFSPVPDMPGESRIITDRKFYSFGRVLTRELLYTMAIDYNMIRFIQQSSDYFFLYSQIGEKITLRPITDNDIVFNKKFKQVWPLQNVR